MCVPRCATTTKNAPLNDGSNLVARTKLPDDDDSNLDARTKRPDDDLNYDARTGKCTHGPF